MLNHSVVGLPAPIATHIIGLLLVGLTFFACGAGRAQPPADQPLSLEALFTQCGLPAACNTPTPWEGRTVTIAANVDPANIFEQRRYPRLPYEKFRLLDGRGRSLEVWPQAADNRPIFDKLAARPSDQIVVQGRLAAFKMPTQSTCRLGVKLFIDHPDRIQFQEK